MEKKMNMVKTVSLAGTLLGLTGTFLTTWASQKTMNETIKKEVEKALANK